MLYICNRILHKDTLLALTSANLHLGDKRAKHNRTCERRAIVRRRFYGSIGLCKALLMRRFVLRIFRSYNYIDLKQ